MYYLYILYSEKHNKYYIGQTNDLDRRIKEHNQQEKNSYTAKYRPWKIVKNFEVGTSLGVARKVENHIKRQKSKIFIERLTELDNIDKIIRKFIDEG
jgi:putative endonuclease